MPRLAIWVVLIAILLWPLAVFPVFGLGDTLNHLARMHILATIAKSPELGRHYEIHWAPIPYLAMDAIVPALATVFPIQVAGRLFVGLCVVMPAASASVLHRAVHGRWSMLPAAGLLIGYSYVLSLGFLNFAFSAGLSVMLFAGWISARSLPRWSRSLLFCVPVMLLYLGHAFACLGYCLAVAGYEIGLCWKPHFRPAYNVGLDWVAAAAQALPALILASRLDLHEAYAGPLATRYGTVSERLTDLLSPFVFRFSAADALVALCLLGIVFFVRRWLLLSEVSAALVSIVIASLCVPTVLWSTWGADLRLPLVAGIVVLGGLSWKVQLDPRMQRLMLAALAGMIGVRSADVAAALRVSEAHISDTRLVLRSFPLGARMLAVDADGPRTTSDISLSTKWQLPLLAVIDRDTFVPTLFTGMTTIRPRSAYLASSTPNGLPIDLAQLREGMSRVDVASRLSDGSAGGGTVYWYGWTTKFDYVLVLHSGAPYTVPLILVSVATSSTADLYKIEKPSR